MGELVDDGIFDWSLDILDWHDAAYDDEQYDRLCAYFIERFRWREISIEPFLEWATTLHRKLVYELMPKYRPLYERVAEGINPISGKNVYHKERVIDSDYPETLLSRNADYISYGKDTEYQTIEEGDFTASMNDYALRFKGVDEMVLDELESMFISLYTANMNALW